MKRFTEQHEWVKLEGGVAVIGITDHAAKELGDITFIELPEVGTALSGGDAIGVVESVKAAADVYCPVSGTVCEVNESLEDAPEVVNESPEGDGWICKLEGVSEADVEALMSEDEYNEFING